MQEFENNFSRDRGLILSKAIGENAETLIPIETNLNVLSPLLQHTSIIEIIYLFCLCASSFPIMTEFLSLPRWCYCSGYAYLNIFGRKILEDDVQCRERITITQKSDLGNTYGFSSCRLFLGAEKGTPCMLIERIPVVSFCCSHGLV